MTKIAFWNVNVGNTSSSGRLDAIDTWALSTDPDILVMEEVNRTIVNLAGLNHLFTNMTAQFIVANTDRNGRPCNCIAVMLKNGSALNIRERRMVLPRGGRRARARGIGRFQIDDKVQVHCYHANASGAGGADALDFVEQTAELGLTGPIIFGGDFNRPIRFAQARFYGTNVTVKPGKGLNNGVYTFTQWAKRDQRTETWPDGTGNRIPAGRNVGDVRSLKEILAHEIIDYAISKEIALTAEQAITTEQIWRTMLWEFDHTPVLYSFNMPP